MADPRQTLLLSDGWHFHRGDVPAPLANKHLAGYMFNKAGYARGAARGNFDDSDWPIVSVPHDWSLDGPFHPDNHVNSGFLPRGIGWYRRTFALDESDRGKILTLRFDAIASHAQIYVNGHLLARSFNGYLPVQVDFTDVATFGDELNTVAVRVDATPMEGWWYEGAGLYRQVWLEKRLSTFIDDVELRVVAFSDSEDKWRLFVRGEAVSGSSRGRDLKLQFRLLNPQGVTIATAKTDSFASPYGRSAFIQEFEVDQPQRWDLDVQYFYRIECDLLRDSITQDSRTIRFGFRTVRFDANEGFFLNDQRIFLKGVCLHQDHAGVGVAVPDSIHRFRVQRLKDMGCNAIRIGHHPPAVAFLDACDELGMLVMDENRSFGSSPEHLSQLAAMVKRDRNHPCVFLWSVCNEEAIQGTPVSRQIAETMIRHVRQIDDTRPITAAISGGLFNEGSLGEALRVVAINYNFQHLDAFHARWPDKPVFASETGCTLSTRGVYKTDPAKFQFASYDDDHAVWGSTAREAFRQVSGRPWMAGMFVWTGFDYRGEPSPHEWPSTLSHWGLIDLCGFEKDAFWRHKAYFSEEPVLHLLPHWNWSAGDTVRVQTLTNCDEVALHLNGRSLGRKKIDPIDMAEWQVPFEPGTLRAVGYRGGEEVLTAERTTTGLAVALGLEIHPSCDAPLDADGETAWPVTIFATDADGRRVPDANRPTTISVDGQAILLGVGNGDPNGQFANREPEVPLFNGLAQAIVQATRTAGEVRIVAKSPGLADGELAFTTKVAQTRPTVPPAKRRHLLIDWQMSQITPTPPDPNQSAAVTDMNTWDRIKAGQPQKAWSTQQGYALYRTTLKPPKAMATRGGKLVFNELVGEAEIFIDGKTAGTRSTIDLPPRTTPADVVVRLKGTNSAAGLNGVVELFLD